MGRKYNTSHGYKFDKKVENFHIIINTIANKDFPEKQITLSNLDKKWMTSQLKQLLRQVQSEHFSKGKTSKWRRLKSKYRKLKRKSVRIQFSNFVNKVKTTNKGNFYKKVKEIGGIHPAGSGELKIPHTGDIESLDRCGS